MHEPKPPKLDPPGDKREPSIRVGVVLPEDKISELHLSAVNTELIAPSLSPQSTSTNKLEVTAHSNQLHINGQICPSPYLLACSEEGLATGRGIQISRVIAGRGFHWRKEISPIFSGTIEIHTNNNWLTIINQLPFEDYLACVISSEMSKNCPVEFMKAQACAARSWAFVFLNNKHPEQNFDVCNDDDCQRYQGVTFLSQQVIDAVRACAGEFILADDQTVVPAYYSKCCGGFIESAKEIFNFDIPNLQTAPDSQGSRSKITSEEDFQALLGSSKGIFCSPAVVPESNLSQYLGSVDKDQAYFRWNHSTKAEQIVSNLREKFDLPEASQLLELTPGRRSGGGRYLSFEGTYQTKSGTVKTLSLNNQYDVRRLLHESFLYSSAFIHSCKLSREGTIESVEFNGLGWGHGVGLCQIGAVGMALQGHSYQEILEHYYPGATLKNTY